MTDKASGMIRFEELTSGTSAVAVVGLGYVGLPLAVALAKHFRVIGFDISQERVDELTRGEDRTREVEPQVLAEATVEYTCEPARLAEAGVILVAVPTPIDGYRRPDLTPVVGASKTVGKAMAPGAVVVYESTVYPGLTEETCVPLLERYSGLTCGRDFHVGYSPERINPGDKVHTLATIVKVVAGDTPEVSELLAQLYGTVVAAGIHQAPSIRVAEAAKVIENTQRDLNIALMNELALIFERMGIDTRDVLAAAGTKWNFLPFTPGLVGGHCIGVDPYYLTYKAESLGLHPKLILAGRETNDSMGAFVARETIKRALRAGAKANCPAKEAAGPLRVGILGLTFKEDVPDLRNTRVVDIIAELAEFGAEVLVHDPLADPREALEEYGLMLSDLTGFTNLSAVVLAVSHKEYLAFGPETFTAMFAQGAVPVLMDVKACLDREHFAQAGVTLWRL